jgi:hypothetical protein
MMRGGSGGVVEGAGAKNNPRLLKNKPFFFATARPKLN